MASPWVEYLGRLKETLAKPRRAWSEAETAEVWNSLAGGPVGFLLYRCVLRRVENHRDAQEVLQGCLLELCMGRNYDPTDRGPNAFRNWVHACVGNHVKRFLKSIAAIPPIDSGDEAIEGLSVDGKLAVARTDARIDTRAMLRTLASRERDVMGRRLKGQTDEEIARDLGLTEVNVRQICYRAIRLLREKYGVSI